MRHANSRVTLEIYTSAISEKKRAAQSRVVEMILPTCGDRTAMPEAGNG